MIPKILHYCWFGNKPKPDIFYKCIESWKRYCPDYEINEWNSYNFTSECTFFLDAIKKNKYAYASDFARAYVLNNYGGIYLDTDVELFSSLDPYLYHQAFSGFETVGLPFTAIWGSEPSHPWVNRIVSWYNNSYDTNEYLTNTSLISTLLEKEWGVDPSLDQLQILKDGIAIYPSSKFCVHTSESVAVHHFEGSWLNKEDIKYHYKDMIHDRLLIREILIRSGYHVSTDKSINIDYVSLGNWTADRLGRKDISRLISHCLKRIIHLTF